MSIKEKISNSFQRLGKYFQLAKKGYKYKLFGGIFTDFLRLPFYLLPHDGVRVMDEDWDYLIVLDACRFDVFSEMNTLEGDLEKRQSLGSFTTEWGNKNFTDYYEDVIYVSANPRVCKSMIDDFEGSEHFYKVVDSWDDDWDEKLNTVPPDRMTQRALKVIEEYPEKRTIIHYIQPHTPYIGETKFLPESPEDFLETKIIANDFFKQAYQDNLKLVLKETEKLIEQIEGKIIVTSDHGEAIGIEPFSHPHHVHIDRLVEIPWLTINKK